MALSPIHVVPGNPNGPPNMNFIATSGLWCWSELVARLAAVDAVAEGLGYALLARSTLLRACRAIYV